MASEEVTTATLLNNVYPFFLDNNKLGSAFYLYQVVTPGLDEDCNPLESFNLVGEKTRPNDWYCYKNLEKLDDLNIFYYLSPNKFYVAPTEYVKNLVWKNYKDEILNVDHGFPNYVYNPTISRSIIVGLRDNLRWRNYKFTPGNLIDILVSPTEFGVYEIKDSGKDLYLELINVYSTKDPGMTNPIEKKVKPINKRRFKGDSVKSEMNRFIRNLEWKAFD